MDEKKKAIIESAVAVYMKFGIKSVTMDEMARQLGVSKKTLYLHVKDKNELVEECLNFVQCSDKEGMNMIFKKKMGAIEELLEVGRYLAKTLGSIHPSIFFDLKKYHPNVLKLIDQYKFKIVKQRLIDNLNNGIKQGVYRDNVNPEIIAEFHLRTMDGVMKGEILADADYKMEAIYSEYFRYHIRGIASLKGLEKLQELIKKDENL
ncbi:TetR/AcrR family transcriptional regulator [Crocinitomix algicola]|uniref:TetR/AcrR family transcriptional regulator n=1 Tax=Crocinitomix algicola TaxID=1740263 RepID=UPI0008345728|nr:TetR/AcrR family transcriptional regulator [Crocinitomix algicola]